LANVRALVSIYNGAQKTFFLPVLPRGRPSVSSRISGWNSISTTAECDEAEEDGSRKRCTVPLIARATSDDDAVPNDDADNPGTAVPLAAVSGPSPSSCSHCGVMAAPVAQPGTRRYKNEALLFVTVTVALSPNGYCVSISIVPYLVTPTAGAHSPTTMPAAPRVSFVPKIFPANFGQPSSEWKLQQIENHNKKKDTDTSDLSSVAGVTSILYPGSNYI
jgi:hypothetical protein